MHWVLASSDLTTTLSSLPAFATDPASLTKVVVGDSATLSCSVSGDGLTITWEKGGVTYTDVTPTDTSTSGTTVGRKWSLFWCFDALFITAAVGRKFHGPGLSFCCLTSF